MNEYFLLVGRVVEEPGHCLDDFDLFVRFDVQGQMLYIGNEVDVKLS